MSTKRETTRREFLETGAKLGAGIAAMSMVSNVRDAHAAEFTQDELCYMPASVQLQLFRRGLLSPSEVLEAQIARIEKHNTKVNCITYKHYESARKSAKAAEARWKAGTARALEGISVGTKDEHGLAGWTITEGSVILKDRKFEANDPIGDFLVKAGAILHIQTTVPEFYLHFCTWTKLWGVTRNPWNLEYSVGGSSGGSGAALAAGFCTIATGSDMGGSIRLPCAWAGAYGYKPPFGRVPTGLPLAPFSGSGPMARTFEDMVRMQNVIARPHTTSMTTLPHMELPLRYPSIQKPHIAADYDYTTAKPTINGKRVHPLGGVVLTPLYNFLNWYPVVNAPVGLTSKRVPMGMQIIANSYQDQNAMRVAAGFAAAAPQFFKGNLMPNFRKS